MINNAGAFSPRSFLLLFVWICLPLIFLAGCRNQNAAPEILSTTPTGTASPQPHTATAAIQSDNLTVTPTLTKSDQAPTPAAPSDSPTIQPSPTAENIQTPSTTSTEVQPSPTPGQPSGDENQDTPPSTPVDETSTCRNLASFYGDVTIPDGTVFSQGVSFEKTWRVRNEGSCTWNHDFVLVNSGGHNLNAPPQNPIPDTAPGETIDITIPLQSPPRGGTYRSFWEFQAPGGEQFGIGLENGPLWVEINVTFFIPPDSGASETTPVSGVGGCNFSIEGAFETELLAILNQNRVARGLAPLESQAQLQAAARAHSQDMACNGFVDHIGSDGSNWFNRIEKQGFANYASSRENIRVGNPDFGFTPQYAIDQWSISQIHADNMFADDVSQIGIGYVFAPQGEYGGYVTAVFARP